MRFAAFFALLLLPQLAFGAGFAKQSLFLSHSPVIEGESVFVHAVVNNDATTTFAGEMVFTEGATSLGKVAVSLKPGEASAVSVSWKPSAGSHKITAELTKGTVSVAKESATFTIERKPEPEATSTPLGIESSSGIQDSIRGVSPGTADALAPMFKLVDGGREALANVVSQQLDNTKQGLPSGKPGGVLGAETAKNATSDPMGTFLLVLRTLYFYLLTLLGFIIASAGIFYPVVAVFILFVLWKLFRRFRRPAY